MVFVKRECNLQIKSASKSHTLHSPFQFARQQSDNLTQNLQHRRRNYKLQLQSPGDGQGDDGCYCFHL